MAQFTYTLQDGRTVTANSKTRVYTHAVAVVGAKGGHGLLRQCQSEAAARKALASKEMRDFAAYRVREAELNREAGVETPSDAGRLYLVEAVAS
ncbi:hypothetical protein SEA_EMOTION_53 [Arthrobacter phage Emotion]|uniref:Uncharacterized protein n=1 Tax=Arthrobacter phage Emotion TaxID=3038361 RepID=A0AA49IGJ5_9CAUD|nr:hypothetical protein SEA_EMOTION_53 [Arthrobacter phage Emotion]